MKPTRTVPYPFFLLLIVFFQLGGRLFLYSHLFEHVTLYCGDSAAYYFMAFSGKALANRPSGISFVLRLLFALFPGIDPDVVSLLFNSLLGTLAHVLFFLTLRRFSEERNVVPFLLSMALFMNPSIWVIDSMVFMSDTFSYFMVSLVLWLILRKTPEGSPMYRSVLASLLLGYLTIVRGVFVYLAPFVVLYMVYKAKKQALFRTAVTGMILSLTFSLIPLSYAFFYNKPRLGIASIENFGGISAFSHILPYLSCEKLLSVAGSPVEEDAVRNFCRDEVIRSSSTADERWNKGSTMNMMEDWVVSHQRETQGRPKYHYQRDRAQGNRILLKWFLGIIVRYPGVGLQAMRESLVDGYLANPLAGASVLQQPHVGKVCESLITRLFSLDRTAYLEMWEKNKDRHFNVFHAIDRLAYCVATVSHTVVLLALCLLPICFVLRRSFNKDALFLYVISLIYLILFSLGNGYDARFSVVLNYCTFLSVGIVVLTHSGDAGEKDLHKIHS